MTIWTIGHSTHSAEEFLGMLRAHDIEAVADVRRFPGSRRYPQFSAEQMKQALPQAGIEYAHFPELGGRRNSKADSPNTNWRNAAFRGYADYMETPEFKQGIARLRELGGRKHTAIMCAEAVWWRCHRGLISDLLKSEGDKVLHILSEKKAEEHPYTSAADVSTGKLRYAPPAQPSLTLDYS